MADIQAGIGPWLGVFLLAHGWNGGRIGSATSFGAITGVLLTAPAGALVDATGHKRWLVVIPGICSVPASAVIFLSQRFWPLALSQVMTAVAGALIAPAVPGITLGMFGQAAFNRQLGINQACDQAGNAVGAGLSGLVAYPHLGNAAMLPLYAIAVSAARQGDPERSLSSGPWAGRAALRPGRRGGAAP